ncbi:MAG: hypothetical protein WCR46_07525 [Deltaproteobacteria bacterium]
MDNSEKRTEHSNQAMERKLIQQRQQLEAQRSTQIRKGAEQKQDARQREIEPMHGGDTMESREKRLYPIRNNPDTAKDVGAKTHSENQRYSDKINHLTRFKNISETERKDVVNKMEAKMDKTNPYWRDSERVTKFGETVGHDHWENQVAQCVEDIGKQDLMQADKWRMLSVDEKRYALEYAGKELGRSFHHPEPPITLVRESPESQAEYGNGHSYDRSSGKIIGSEYGIRMNEEAITQRQEKLFGKDPKAALETLSHEFRHSYQCEQAQAFEKGFKTDDPVKAREWAENYRNDNYKYPPDSELYRTDPERYRKEYEAYSNQPVEQDARAFGSRIASGVYAGKKFE